MNAWDRLSIFLQGVSTTWPEDARARLNALMHEVSNEDATRESVLRGALFGIVHRYGELDPAHKGDATLNERIEAADKLLQETPLPVMRI